MYARQREWCQCPLTLADSEPHDECDHSHDWVMVGKAKHNEGGSEMGKYAPCQEEWQHLYTFQMWNAPTHQRGTLTTCRGVASYPPLEMTKTKIMKKLELTATAQGHAPPKQVGARGTPKCYTSHCIEQPWNTTPFKTPNCDWQYC